MDRGWSLKLLLLQRIFILQPSHIWLSPTLCQDPISTNVNFDHNDGIWNANTYNSITFTRFREVLSYLNSNRFLFVWIVNISYWVYGQLCPLREHQCTPLKRKCCHFDEIFITGCTGRCQNDNVRCSQWCKFRQNSDISVSHYCDVIIGAMASQITSLKGPITQIFFSIWLRHHECCWDVSLLIKDDQNHITGIFFRDNEFRVVWSHTFE